ncbi:bifunctional 3-(3-hydroxy-phenyl)propionate/3-hydroxycinnamic acid hydroxylase [Paludibacterium sp.]|uniref:bifunctional 3-(3-hydroxy-phenyl)propionate/3-hydroxycinnamic acid hydroxylase n=1 Tax=Paludibacterium sp. TaxID=1917523 RepID=UPI0025CE39A7|nr:bifunctional 3-(3-hydroxy-phenyl)propionate/3-hydroxycinnamic acid hydroxylase [Paludibacterium sp.]MBV8646839.1 bifunctional 3-(3-hydroxy-phenyl)propionate/3-hydroxycinnamic acid hydroxylase [Paludibacterium sp.]
METQPLVDGGARASPPNHPPPLPNRVDVLIVGLGPVGAVIANLLARYGVHVLAVDKARDIFTAPRAIALDNEALRILQMAGISETDFDTVAISHVRLCSPQLGEFARANTLGSLDGHPKLVTFHQPSLERLLRNRLNDYPGAQVALGVTLMNIRNELHEVSAKLDLGQGQIHTVRADYLVGADGAGSLVRKLIGQGFRGKTFSEDWLVVDASNAPKPIDHVEFHCCAHRPIPRMVAPGGRQRWEFMLRPGETSQEMESDDRVRELLAPWGRIEEMHIERKAVYRFHARVVDRFRQGRVFLAGDAAHVTPPFVGQGLVAGLRDAANLSWKLAWVLQGRAMPHILDSYDQERRPHAKAMINFAKFMGKLVMPRNAVLALLIHGLMRATRLIPPLRAQFEELEMKPKNVFRHGLFIPGRSASKLRRGASLPQGWVRGADGTIHLSDDVLGPGLALIGFGSDIAATLDSETAHAFAMAGGRVVQITHRGQSLHLTQGCHWEDLEGAFLPRAVPFGWAVLVRPDRTVLYDGPAGDAARIVREGLALLGTTAAHAAPPLPVHAIHPF